MKSFGRFIRGKGFEGLFTILAAGSIFYVADRLGRLVNTVFSCNAQWLIGCVLALLMGYMLFYIKSKKKIKTTRKLYEACSVGMCFLLYLVLFLWGFDFFRWIFQWNDDRAYFIPLLCSIVITVYGFLHAKKRYLKTYDITIPGGTEQKLVLLSDIHLGTFVNAEQLEQIVAKVNELHPDLICIVGDLFDVDAFPYCDKQRLSTILQKFRPQGHVFAVLGNHDPNSQSEEIRAFYRQAKIRLLVDETVESDSLLILGRDDITTNPNRKPLKELLPEGGSTFPILVLDHNPLGMEEAVKSECDCILCGHTHRGQFFPANLFTKLAYGAKGFYGYGKTGCTQSIVSSGAGYFQMPMRVGSNSEIVVVQMRGE